MPVPDAVQQEFQAALEQEAQAYEAELRQFVQSWDVKKEAGGGWESVDRDGHGRWTDGGGTDLASTFSSLAAGQHASVAPRDVESFMAAMRSEPAFNLEHVSISGEGNEHLFDAHLSDRSREQMPQLTGGSATMDRFSGYLAEHGLTGTVEQVDPRTLTATQIEMSGPNVAGVYDSLRATGGRLKDSHATLLISREGGVLEGHHRWAAVAAWAVTHPGTRIQVLRINASNSRVLDVMTQFSQSEGIPSRGMGHKGAFGEQPTAPPPDGDSWLWFDGQWLAILTDDEAVQKDAGGGWESVPRDSHGEWTNGGDSGSTRASIDVGNGRIVTPSPDDRLAKLVASKDGPGAIRMASRILSVPPPHIDDQRTKPGGQIGYGYFGVTGDQPTISLYKVAGLRTMTNATVALHEFQHYLDWRSGRLKPGQSERESHDAGFRDRLNALRSVAKLPPEDVG